MVGGWGGWLEKLGIRLSQLSTKLKLKLSLAISYISFSYEVIVTKYVGHKHSKTFNIFKGFKSYHKYQKSFKTLKTFKTFNPIKRDVSYSQLNAGGGHFDQPLEIHERAPLDPILLNVILRPTKFMITYKKSRPYLKN